MPSNSGFTRINNLPGQQRRPGAQSATESVASFQNQTLPGLSTGTQRQGPDTSGLSPSQQLLSMRSPETGVQLSAKRTTDAVRATNQRMLASAQLQGQKRRQAEQQRQGRQGVPGGYNPQQAGRGAQGRQPGAGGGGGGGPAVSRIQGILRSFPGLRITETLGNRDYDRAHGVARGPNSYHYDQGNPAVDIAGSPRELQALYQQLVAQGGWRQILWQVPGHYDHIHVAAEGGVVGVEDSPYAAKTVPGPMRPIGPDTVPTMLEPGEMVVTTEATDRIGPDKLDAINKGAELEDVSGQPSESAVATAAETGAPPPVPQGADVTALVSMAYKKFGGLAQQAGTKGSVIPGVRTALRNLRPGDLVAWKDGSHIAVYAGNGEVVESEDPRRGTVRRKLWAPENAVYGIALRLPGE